MKKLLLTAFVFAGLALSNLNAQVERHLVFEHFTTEGATAGPSSVPKIQEFIESMVQTTTISWISHHVGAGTDFLTVPESSDLIHLYKIGNSGIYAPAYMLNREKFIGRVVRAIATSQSDAVSQISTAARYIMERPVQATISLDETDMTYDEGTRTFRIKITADVTASYTGADNFYLNVALTENNIKSQNQAGADADFVHDHVLRKFLGGAAGKKVDPNNALAEFEFVLPESWKPGDMKVIIMAHRDAGSETAMPSNPAIYCAKEYPFPYTETSISSVADKHMKVYAHEGQIVIEGQYLSAQVYDLHGRLMPQIKLHAGVYVVSVKTHTGIYTHKVQVN